MNYQPPTSRFEQPPNKDGFIRYIREVASTETFRELDVEVNDDMSDLVDPEELSKYISDDSTIDPEEKMQILSDIEVEEKAKAMKESAIPKEDTVIIFIYGDNKELMEKFTDRIKLESGVYGCSNIRAGNIILYPVKQILLYKENKPKAEDLKEYFQSVQIRFKAMPSKN